MKNTLVGKYYIYIDNYYYFFSLKEMRLQNKEASWLYAELFVNDETLKNVNDEEWILTICHSTLSLSQKAQIRSESSILSSLPDLARNRETSPKTTI